MVSIFDDTAIKHIVNLNGNAYVVVTEGGDIAEQNAAEFAVQIAQGPPSQDTRENLSYWTMANWTPGLGIKFGDFREHQGRYWFASGVDPRFSEQLTLGPLVQQLGATQTVGQAIGTNYAAAATSFRSADYFGITDKIYENVSGTLTERLDLGTISVEALQQYTDTAGTLRLYAFSSSNRFNFSTDGTTWVQSDAGVLGTSLIDFDRTMILLGGDATVRDISTATTGDGAAASYSSILLMGGTGTDQVRRGVVFLGPGGDRTPYFVQRMDNEVNAYLYRLDIYERVPRFIDLGPGQYAAADGLNGQREYMKVWNSKLYIPDKEALIEYGSDGSARPLGFATTQGVPASYGPFGHLLPLQGQLFFNSGIGSTHAIGAYNGTGFHFLITRTVYIRTLHLSTLQSPARLYWIEIAGSGTSASVYYVALPTSGENPINDSTYVYASTGYLITPWVDGGFADLDKILFRMRIRAEQLTATETVVIDYQLDDSGADASGWTNLGTFDDPADILRFGASNQGLGARSFRFRITLNRGATTTLTPIVRAITLDFLVTPEYRAAKQFVIDLGATIRHRGEPYVSIATLLAEFETAFELGTLPAYAFDNDTETRVKVVSYATNLWDLELPDPQTNAVRDGMTRMQIIEMIA